MLGPDVMVQEPGGQRIPLIHRFSSVLAQKLESDEYYAKRLGTDLNDLAHISQIYSNRYGRADLEVEAENFFRLNRATNCVAVSNLAALPFRLIVDTTPNLDIDECICKQGKKCVSSWYHFGPRVEDTPLENTVEMDGTAERPLVYHLYGCIQAPESLVLTENDLLRFLVAVISSNPALPKHIISEIRKPENCFLFLGFGFKHWYLRILLHVLDATGRSSRSFALENFDTAAGAHNVEQTTLFFQEGHKINFFNMDLRGFTEELSKHCAARLAPKQGDEAPAPSCDAPLVFLCHANEDKLKAKNLAAELKKHGFMPWLDEEDLCGGDEWDRKIETVITKEIDYFVVLQSKALQKREVGYVNKEIDLALQKQTEVRAPRIFIVPALIEECKKLDALLKWQSRDLSNPDGINRLVNELERDVERGRKGR